MDQVTSSSALRTAAVGLIGLAAAMGIGRFAFTPLLPLMQADHGLSLTAGGWLAAANYAGYFAGALLCMLLDPAPRTSVRGGLLAVALTTLAMGADVPVAVWMVLRTVAGAASAFVLVGVSSWSLGMLARAGRQQWSGVVFSGVGFGMALAGAIGLAAAAHAWHAERAWLALGVLAALATVMAWRPVADARVAGATHTPAPRLSREHLPLVIAYGAFGFGYIIPATFLPALAREQLGATGLSGWLWPAFGIAAAVSTLVAAHLPRSLRPRRLWLGSQLVMAAGVAAPALSTAPGALFFSAVAIGATFMVMTLAAMQEARRVGGAAAARLMAAMTAAFAIGQLVGPLTIRSGGTNAAAAMAIPSLVAAAVLVAAAALLAFERRPEHTAVSTSGSNS
jgi:predicted MFS family arabinose efflux permease